MPYRTLILDFDGVILESNDHKTEAFARVFAEFPEHLDAMMAFHHANVSLSRFEKFRYLVTARLKLQPDDPLVADLATRFSTEMLSLITDCEMVPGAAEFLAEMAPRVSLYLSSMTPQDELETILSRLGLAETFTGVYGFPPCSKREAIARVLQEQRLASSEVLFIGDSAGDQRASAAAGVDFLARDSGLPFDDPRPRAFSDMRAVLSAVRPMLPPAGEPSAKGLQ